jgi:hypothetical protein
MNETEKEYVKMTGDIRKGWEEARVCAILIKQGRARIVVITKADGTKCRFTKPW